MKKLLNCKSSSTLAVLIFFAACSDQSPNPSEETDTSQSARPSAEAPAPETPVPALNLSVSIGGRDVRVSETDILPPLQRGDELTSTFATGSQLSKAQIRDLAKSIGLLDETRTNPHLSFLGGDISFWHDEHVRGLSATRLEAEFIARKVVLDAADRTGAIIPEQGDLSAAAGRLVGEIMRNKTRLLSEDG